MSVLALAERARYEDVWAALGDRYAQMSPGEEYAPLFAEVATPGQLVLDAGCGSGKGMLALAARGFEVIGCDLTAEGLIAEAAHFPYVDACLWHPLRPQLRRGRVDWVYCCDVLEHLPEQFTMLAVTEMLALATCGVFLTVSLGRDQAGDWVTGGPLHQTVQSFVWWRDSLRELAQVTDARDLIGAALFVVKPR